MYYTLDKNLQYIAERVMFESESNIFNAAFMLDRHIDDPEFLDTELFTKLMDDVIDSLIEAFIIREEIIYNMAGVNVKGRCYLSSKSVNSPLAIVADEITGGEPEHYENIDEILQIPEYGDWLGHLYPEFALDIDRTTGDDYSKAVHARTLTFQVTDDCNLACKYCYQINKSTRKMSLEDIKKVMNMILDQDKGMDKFISKYYTPGIIFEFIGGEPFLECELIEQAATYWMEQAITRDSDWKNRCIFSFSSNGTLYKQDNVQRFLQKFNRKVSLGITVDGYKELHDSCRLFKDGKPSYDLAYYAAINWANRGHNLNSKVTISPLNLKYLATAFTKMVEAGYTDIHANYVFEKGWETKHAREAYEQIKQFTDRTLNTFSCKNMHMSLLDVDIKPEHYTHNSNWCGGDGAMLSVDPDGHMYPCIRYMESSVGTDVEPVRIGNVNTGYATTEEERCRLCSLKVTRREQSTPECFLCVAAGGCGGCTGYNYQVYGTTHKRATFICEVHKARALYSAYYRNKHKANGDDIDAMGVWLGKSESIRLIGEDNYNELVELTKSVGGFVNETDCNFAICHGETITPETVEFIKDEDVSERIKGVDKLIEEHEEKKRAEAKEKLENLDLVPLISKRQSIVSY